MAEGGKTFGASSKARCLAASAVQTEISDNDSLLKKRFTPGKVTGLPEIMTENELRRKHS